eukprot:366069-Chlamydomonas_euryale.AAC.3
MYKNLLAELNNSHPCSYRRPQMFGTARVDLMAQQPGVDLVLAGGSSLQDSAGAGSSCTQAATCRRAPAVHAALDGQPRGDDGAGSSAADALGMRMGAAAEAMGAAGRGADGGGGMPRAAPHAGVGMGAAVAQGQQAVPLPRPWP